MDFWVKKQPKITWVPTNNYPFKYLEKQEGLVSDDEPFLLQK